MGKEKSHKSSSSARGHDSRKDKKKKDSREPADGESLSGQLRNLVRAHRMDLEGVDLLKMASDFPQDASIDYEIDWAGDRGGEQNSPVVYAVDPRKLAHVIEKLGRKRALNDSVATSTVHKPVSASSSSSKSFLSNGGVKQKMEKVKRLRPLDDTRPRVGSASDDSSSLEPWAKSAKIAIASSHALSFRIPKKGEAPVVSEKQKIPKTTAASNGGGSFFSDLKSSLPLGNGASAAAVQPKLVDRKDKPAGGGSGSFFDALAPSMSLSVGSGLTFAERCAAAAARSGGSQS